jgi:CRP/FNR family transcriptional regulator, cyclic AMP receptor protein
VDDETRRSPLPGLGDSGLDSEAAVAVTRSLFGSLPAASLTKLLADVSDVVFPAGGTVHPAGDTPFFHLVVRGVVRTVAASSDGRRTTIRYVRPGEFLGSPSLFSTRPRVVAGEALHEARVLMFRPGVVRRLALSDPAVAEALFTELADRVVQYHAELVGSSFAGLRQKVARHLLDIAAESADGDALVARISQAELADAVGTSREVVVRVLRDLREEGLVETGRGGVTVLAPEQLHVESDRGAV